MTRTRSILLPEEICRRLEERYASPERPHIDEIFTFIATELLKDESRELEEREETLLKSRLEELGYL